MFRSPATPARSSVLPATLNYLAGLRIAEGNLDAAATLLDEADAITAATGNARTVVGRLVLAACRGDEAAGVDPHRGTRA